MSVVPLLRFDKTQENRALVHYDVLSPDFHADAKWLCVGRLMLHRRERWHRFEPCGPWLAYPIVPLQVHAFWPAMREHLLKTRYRDAMHARYTERIFHRARRMLESNAYPEQTIVST